MCATRITPIVSDHNGLNLSYTCIGNAWFWITRDSTRMVIADGHQCRKIDRIEVTSGDARSHSTLTLHFTLQGSGSCFCTASSQPISRSSLSPFVRLSWDVSECSMLV